MKKYFILLTALFAVSNSIFGQDWITLKIPQSGILGAPIREIKKGDLNYNFGLKYDKNPALDARESAESIEEYEDKFRNFVSQFIDSKKVQLLKTKAYRLKVRSLSQEAVSNLQVGGKYIYEGIAADSVRITLSAKKEFSADISKSLKELSKALTTPSTTKIIEKVAPFLDSIQYTKNDSVFYEVFVRNPNVYYKVKAIKLEKLGNPCNCDWEKNCFLYFTNENKETGEFPRTIKLEHDFTGEKSSTIARYPEFCGKDRKDVQVFIKTEKDNKGLHLWVYFTTGNVENPPTKIEVPYQDDVKGRKWRLDRTFLYRFDKDGIIKNLFVEVSARQISETAIELINWRENTNSYGDNALTCLKYPEFRGIYVTK